MDEINSILNSVKSLLGINEDDGSYDTDVLVNVNAAIARLTQLGVGPSSGFFVDSADVTYEDFLGEKTTQKNLVRQYLYIKTRIVFDASTMSSSLLNSFREEVNELEFRLLVQNELTDKEDEIQNE